MVEVGRIEATVTADSRQFVAGMRRAEQATMGIQGQLSATRAGFVKLAGSIGAAVTGISTIANAVGRATSALVALEESIAIEASIARGLGLAREEYTRLALALQATGQDRDEIRDILSDFQEVVGLLVQGEEKEIQLLRQLGLDASIATRSVDDLGGAFRQFLDAVSRYNRVEARGILSLLVGADASRRIGELIAAREQFEAAAGRAETLPVASDQAVRELTEFAQAVREARQAATEASVQVLSSTGILDAFVETIRNTGGQLSRAATSLSAAAAAFESLSGRNIGEVLAAFGTGGVRGLTRLLATPTDREQDVVAERQLQDIAASLRELERLSAERGVTVGSHALELQFADLTRALLERQSQGADVAVAPGLLPLFERFSSWLTDVETNGVGLAEAFRRLTETSLETENRLAAAESAGPQEQRVAAAVPSWVENRMAAIEVAVVSLQSPLERQVEAIRESRALEVQREIAREIVDLGRIMPEVIRDQTPLLERQAIDLDNTARLILDVLPRLAAAGLATPEKLDELSRLLQGQPAAAGVQDQAARAIEATRAQTIAQEQDLATAEQQRVQTLSTAFSAFFAQAQNDISDLRSAFQAFVQSLANALLSQYTAQLAASLIGGATGGRQAGGPVEAGRLYQTHGLGRTEFFLPARDGEIVVGQPAAAPTVNIAVTGDPDRGTLRRIETTVRNALLYYDEQGRVP